MIHRDLKPSNVLVTEQAGFLKDEPIEARPPSTTYRLKKFVKRNTVGVIASAAAVVALIGGAVADFEGYLATRDSTLPAAVQRRTWVGALRAGQNPFTEDELNKLRF